MESDTFDPIAPADQSGPENSGPVTPVAPDATGAIPDLAVTREAVGAERECKRAQPRIMRRIGETVGARGQYAPADLLKEHPLEAK